MGTKAITIADFINRCEHLETRGLPRKWLNIANLTHNDCSVPLLTQQNRLREAALSSSDTGGDVRSNVLTVDDWLFVSEKSSVSRVYVDRGNITQATQLSGDKFWLLGPGSLDQVNMTADSLAR